MLFLHQTQNATRPSLPAVLIATHSTELPLIRATEASVTSSINIVLVSACLMCQVTQRLHPIALTQQPYFPTSALPTPLPNLAGRCKLYQLHVLHQRAVSRRSPLRKAIRPLPVLKSFQYFIGLFAKKGSNHRKGL